MARHAYNPSALRWDYAFEDILSTDAQDVDHFDYRRFHEIKPFVTDPRLAPEVGTDSSKA